MPIEKRDYNTGALLFVPTQSEQSTKETSLKMQKGLKEIEDMKSELRSLLDEAKKNKK